MLHQDSQLFEDEVPLITCLPQLNNFRTAGRLTDLTIKLQHNVQLHAHRLILASRIPSLRDSLIETDISGQVVVLRWPKTSPKVASSFITYIYTGLLEVHENNAVGLILLSQQLEIPRVEEWAVNFMASRLNSENINKHWELAQWLNSNMLSNACLQYIKTNFESMILSDVFTQLPPDSVLSLLQADDLEVKREESVFEAVGRWMSPLGVTDDTRLVHAETMLKEVRWNQIDAEFRYKLFDHVGFWNRNVECSRLLGRIIKWIENSSSKDDGQCPFNERKRGRLGNICVLSGSSSSAPPVLYQYDLDAKTSEKLTEVTGGLDAAFVVIEDLIFAIGGNKKDNNYTNIDKFDIRKRRWSECAPLPLLREKHTAVAVTVGGEKVICVFGGHHPSNFPISACELYCPRENRWYQLPYLKQARQCATAVALADGRVFVIGGEALQGSTKNSSYVPLSSVEICHLRQPADWKGQRREWNVFWKDAADMLEPSKDRVAVAFRDRIFIARNGFSGLYAMSVVDVFTLPDYLRPLGQWTHLDTWKMWGTSVGMVVCQDGLFLFSNDKKTREFIPPADPSTPSRGKFDLWTWVEREKVNGINSIQRAFPLR